MTTKPKTSNKKHTTISQREAALKREIDRLQKKNAKLEAQLFTATNQLKIQEPVIRAANAQKEEASRKKKEARAALMAADDETDEALRKAVA